MKKLLVIKMLAVCLLLSVSTTYAYAAKTVIHYDPWGYRPREKPYPLTMMKVIVEEYEKLHPDIDIELVGVGAYGGQDYTTWLNARLATKSAPEICWQNYEWYWQICDKGWFTPWEPYLTEPNPYVSGNEHWRDIFDPVMFEEVRAPDGRIYDVAADGVGVAIAYNKDIFKKAGVGVPKTWAEFMRTQAKIQQVGVIPFGFQTAGAYWYGWFHEIISGMLVPEEQVAIWDTDKNGKCNMRELAVAVAKGTFRADLPYNKESWRLMKEWSKFWPPGFSGKLDLKELFLGQKIAMYMAGSWDHPVIEKDPLREFEWGMFNLPPITQESSTLGTGKLCTIYGSWGALQWHIPSYLPKKVKDIAVDFCMYLSAPKNVERLILEKGGVVSNVKGAKSCPGLEVMRDSRAVRSPLPGMQSMFTKGFADKYHRLTNLFMTDEVSFDEYISRIQKLYEEAGRELAGSHPEWEIKF